MISEIERMLGIGYACKVCHGAYYSDEELIDEILCPHCGNVATIANYFKGKKNTIGLRVMQSIYEVRYAIKKTQELIEEYKNAESIGGSYYLLFQNNLYNEIRLVKTYLEQLYDVNKEIKELSQKEECIYVLKKRLTEFAKIIEELEIAKKAIQEYIQKHENIEVGNDIFNEKKELIERLKALNNEIIEFNNEIKEVIIKISSLYI